MREGMNLVKVRIFNKILGVIIKMKRRAKIISTRNLAMVTWLPTLTSLTPVTLLYTTKIWMR